MYYNIPGLLPEFHYSRQRNVESFTVQPSFDTMIATRHGVYGAQAVTHDITRKKLVYHTPFNYETDFAKRPHLAKYNMVPSSGLANQKKVPGQLSNYSQSGYGLYPKQSYLYDGAIHVKYPEMYIFQRNSQLSQTKTMTIGVLIPGDTSIRLGSVIAWKHFPSFEQSTEGVPQPKDELLSLKKAIGQTDAATILSKDILKLVEMFCCLFGLKQAGLRLIALDTAMCPSFHVDRVPCRLITTYQGIATEWIPHLAADRSKLGLENQRNSNDTSGLFNLSLIHI